MTAVWSVRAKGALVVEIADHELVTGLYRAPVLVALQVETFPPHTIISDPVQMAVWLFRADGADVVVVAIHESASGSYRLPVLTQSPKLVSSPPQIIICPAPKTALKPRRTVGAKARVVTDHVSSAGSYLPPVSVLPPRIVPPQTIISAPLQTVVWLTRPAGAPMVLVATHTPTAQQMLPHRSYPVLQVNPHVLLAHVAIAFAGGTQTFPHEPQLLALVAIFISHPSAALSLQSRFVPEHAMHSSEKQY